MRRRGLEILSALGMVTGLAGSLFCEMVPSQRPAQVVAQVLGKEILSSDLEPDVLSGLWEGTASKMDSQERQTGLEVYQKERIRSLIIEPLLEEYARNQKVVPSDSEIESLVDLLSHDESLKEQKFAEQQFLDEMKVRKEELEQALKGPGLSQEKENELFEELIRLEKAIAQMEQQTLEEELAQTAAQAVKTWKINQSLYERYKGRVIFQQAGPEPLDAYRQFLEERQQEGAFQIYDPHLVELFWEYFVRDDMHVFSSAEEGDRLMKTPWWLMEREEQI